ncbi:hypothetical protein JJ685_24475 [Ramlibacter monticola]|uniref:Uncharacterized protein n=1 Tax=Ramlibacter monticola TaxID=1926872 RepID=A0A936Z3S9_9BURK|nr:hypothetical protein [Ramlibacter monticola]MBL0394318.1 hypothetical protein [Ramlibacter monticola]
MMNYDRFRVALADCVRVDDVKDIRDKAKALELYALQKNDRKARRDMAEIKLRAMVRIGEITRELPKVQGLRRGTSSAHAEEVTKREALHAAGISTSCANDYERIAAGGIAVDKYFATTRAKGDVPTQKALAEAVATHTGRMPITAKTKKRLVGNPLPPKKAARLKRELAEAARMDASMLCMYARLLLRAIAAANGQFSDEERHLLDEVSEAIEARRAA